MIMDTSESKLTLTRSRVLQSVYDTMCVYLDLQKVGAKLLSEEKLKASVAKKVKYAIKKDDIKIFYAVLENRFDFKSFVYFLEILDKLGDENHGRILTIISPALARMEPEPDSDTETREKMKSIAAKYHKCKHELCQTPTAIAESTSDSHSTLPSTHQTEIDNVILYDCHDPETAVMCRTGQTTLYSPSHDITVVVDPKAFPGQLDEFSMTLTVNDYFQAIRMQENYSGIYSALISLQCDPEIEKFKDYVTVTVPHCAVGDIDCLCVLSAPEGENLLKEDPDIQIKCSDDYYLTFRTLHFSKHRLCRKKRLQKSGKTKSPSSLLQKAVHLSLDESSPSASALTTQEYQRSYSCPTDPAGSMNARFCAIMCEPSDKATSCWQIAFIVTYCHISLTSPQELESYASSLLPLQAGQPIFHKAEFLFLKDVIEFRVVDSKCNGWSITSKTSPATIDKHWVETYWHMPREEREKAKKFAPYLVFTIAQNDPGSSECTSFTIVLEGSRSRLERAEPISFSITFQAPALSPLATKKQYPIKLIHTMYASNSAVLEGVVGHKNPSLVLIRMDDEDCCLLLCEISFHLFLWKSLGDNLGLNECVEFLSCKYANVKYVPCFEMLKEWVRECPDPNLGILIKELNAVNFFLELSSWTTSYHTVRPRTIDAQLINQLAMKVKYQWMFIARVLVKSESFIDAIANDFPNSAYEQAYQMVHQWRRHSPLVEKDAYMKLFNSIHLVYEHNRAPSLLAALSWLQ